MGNEGEECLTCPIPTLASSLFVGLLEEKASSFSESFSGWRTPPPFE
jgi:hypothetical protein